MGLEIAGVALGGKVLGFVLQEVTAIVFAVGAAVDEKIIDAIQFVIEVAIDPGAELRVPFGALLPLRFQWIEELVDARQFSELESVNHFMRIDVVKKEVVAQRIVQQKAIGECRTIELRRIANASRAEGWCAGSQAGSGIEAALRGEKNGADEGRSHYPRPEFQAGGFQLQPDKAYIVMHHFPKVAVGSGIFHDGISHVEYKARQVAIAQLAARRDQGVQALASIHHHAAAGSYGKAFDKSLVPFLAFVLIDDGSYTARNGADEPIIKQRGAPVVLGKERQSHKAKDHHQCDEPGKAGRKRCHNLPGSMQFTCLLADQRASPGILHQEVHDQ